MDRYYTPEPLARDLLEQSTFAPNVARVLDPSCGSGALLSAAETVLGAKNCVGIDRDRQAIRALKRSKPHWHLSVADLLCSTSVGRSAVGKMKVAHELLLLNPPFSQAGRKFAEWESVEGVPVRVGQAMKFLLQAITAFQPRLGVVAIVPESLIYSELDSVGRGFLASQFEMRELRPLKSTTFKGARVRSIAVELVRGRAEARSSATGASRFLFSVGLERGVLPVHLVEPKRGGPAFVHSSDLALLANGQMTRVSVSVSAGRVTKVGWVVFLPRVGLPRADAVKAIELKQRIRLSDCVFALWCEDRGSATQLEQLLIANWGSLLDLYRGTGARYTTISRLMCWLADHGVRVHRL